MSIEPPKKETSRGIPGMVIPLAFVSVILLGAILVFGALAFDINIPGISEEEPELARPEDVLEDTGFVVRERSSADETTIVRVEVTVANTADLPVPAFQLAVQCDDGGYVSAIQEVSGMEGGDSRTVSMELMGRGEPGCEAPVVEFASQRSES